MASRSLAIAPSVSAASASANAAAVGVRGLRSDTLLVSIVMLLTMTVVQRGIGFVRGVLLCRWLEPSELGQWDMALGFLELAAPVAVLGIPGSFGRYVQRYLLSGQFRSFLRQTMVVTALLASASIAALVLQAGTVSDWLFGTRDKSGTVLLLAGGLGVLVAYYFQNTVLTGLLQNRVSYRLELIQSLAFTGLALLLVGLTDSGACGVIIAYAAACGVSLVVGLVCFRASHQPVDHVPLPARSLWPTLLPFALWVWGTNWLANLFELTDRYMLVHFSGLASDEALGLVGNYHSARIVPLLLVSVTASLGTILTPYLSRDWEAGHREAVGVKLNLFVKVVSWLLCAGAVAIMWIGPWLFGTALRGKYAGGETVLPWTLTYCIWFGVARVSQKYLWCVERVGLATLAWSLGLGVNVVLNLVLLPRLGLSGVVLATAAGNFVSLVLIAGFNRYLGLHTDRGMWALLALPLALPCGPLAATAVLAIVLLLACKTSHVLSEAERNILYQTGLRGIQKLRAKANLKPAV